MLPQDSERCAGFTSEASHERCTRRFSCARFLSRAGANTPFRMSACEGGDSFIHAGTVAHDAPGAHPAPVSRPGVLDANTSTPNRG